MRRVNRALSILLAVILAASLGSFPASAEPGDADNPWDVRVRALIDGRSVLCYSAGYLWWEHYEFNKPGEESQYVQVGEDEFGEPVYEWVLQQGPVYIDDQPWVPTWSGEEGSWISDRLFVGEKYSYFERLETMQARGPVEIFEFPSELNGNTLKIEFDDSGPGSSDWYECIVRFSGWFYSDVRTVWMSPPGGGVIREGQSLYVELESRNAPIQDVTLIDELNWHGHVPFRFETIDRLGLKAGFEFDMSFLTHEDFVSGEARSFSLDVRLAVGGYSQRVEFVLYPTTETAPVQNITKTVAAGEGFIMAILDDGSLWGWGRNEYNDGSGVLGDGTKEMRTSPVKIMENVVSVQSGYGHTVALRADGSVWTWGENNRGQLGNGSYNSSEIPVKVMDGAVSIAAGFDSSAAIKENGELWVWGTMPGVGWSNCDPLARMENVASVAFGNGFLLAVKRDGSLWGQGVNHYGQLGVGHYRDTNYDESFHIMDDVVSVAAGYEHSLAITMNGTLYAWGCNNQDQVTSNWQYDYRISRPIKVTDNAVYAFAGTAYSLAVIAPPPAFNGDVSVDMDAPAPMSCGTLIGWGTGEFGQLKSMYSYDDYGRGIIAENVSYAAASYYNIAVLDRSGGLTVLGDNRWGQYGEERLSGTPVPNGLEGVSSVAAGMHHSLAVTEDGSLWTWGNNENGQLGDGSWESRYTPAKILDDVKSAYGASDNSYAIDEDGSLWAWGGNYYGQLGTGESGWNTYKQSPVKIMDNVAAFACGYYHALAVKTDGSLWAWGYNNYGQLGNGESGYTASKSSPVRIMDGGVASVAAWGEHSLAVKTDGSLWGWGQNGSYQLGLGNMVNQLTPVKIMEGVKSAAAGYYHSLAVKTDGTLWAWGRNVNGQIGNGVTSWDPAVWSKVPERVMEDVSFARASGSFSFAVKNDGSLWSFGDNWGGQLGDGSLEQKALPVKVLEGVRDAAAGDGHGMAVKTDGSVWSWGYNEYGQLGVEPAGHPVFDFSVKHPEELNVAEDMYPPDLAFYYPLFGRHNGTVQISGSASDDVGLDRIELVTSFDDEEWTAYETAPAGGQARYQFSFELDTADFPDGELIIGAIAYDLTGKTFMGRVGIITIDNTPPAPPTEITVTPALGSITLSWPQSTESDFSHYALYRAAGEDSPLEYVANLGTRTTYTDTNVIPKTTYYYQFYAFDTLGNGGASEAVAAQTLRDEEIPIVTSVTPAEGSWLVGTKEIAVTAQDNFRLAAIELQTSVDAGETWQTYASAETTASTYYTARFQLDSAKFADGALRVRAVARDIWDNESDGYPIRNYRVDNTPPARVEGFAFAATTTKLTLSWQDVPDGDFDHFRLETKSGDEFVKTADIYDKLGYIMEGLSPNTSYVFRVAAVDRAGNIGPYSDLLTAATLADIYPPVVTSINPKPAYFNSAIPLVVTAGDDHHVVKLILESSRDAKNWTQFAAFDSFTPHSTVTVNYSMDVSEISAGSLYIRALAYDASGNTSDSGETAPYVEYMIDHTPPAAPAGVALSPQVGYIEVRWLQNLDPDLAGYNVWRSESEAGEYASVASGLKTLNYVDRAVAEGVTYYYKVSAIDLAGNESGLSPAVSGAPVSDDVKPRILSVSPASGSTLGKSPRISILASDNYRLAKISAEYRVRGAAEWISLGEALIDSASYTWQITLDTTSIGERDIELRVMAEDAGGNASDYREAEYSIDLTPPQTPAVTVTPGPMSITVSWTSGGEPDLAGFRLYRRSDIQAGYSIIAQIPASSLLSFIDRSVDVTRTYSYRVEAVDLCGNAAYADSPYVAPVNTDAEAPVAVISAPAAGESKTSIRFDGSASADNVGVHSYLWDFGDGGTSAEARPTHVYQDRGAYTVRLTVADFAGHTDTAETTILIHNREDIGTARILLQSETGVPLPNIKVYINLGSEDMEIIKTDSSGWAEIKKLPGSYLIGAYDEDYLPVKKEVVFEAGKTVEQRWTMVYSKIVVGDLDFHRMTLEEIIEAGIDIYAPENQNVFKFEITLTYGVQTHTIEIITNGAGEMISGGEPIIFEDYTGSGGGSVSFTPAIVPGRDPEKPVVVVIQLPGEAKWLKDFFDVNLYLLNKADPGFSLVDCSATLNIPDGLTLMQGTTASGSATVNFGTLRGQESKNIHWILRGDVDGSYDLSADFSAMLADFNEQVRATFKAGTPLVVDAAEGLFLDIYVQDRIMAGQDGRIKLGLSNSGTREIYMPALRLDAGTLTASYKTRGTAPADTTRDILFPGETLWVEYAFPTGLDNAELYLISQVLACVGGNTQIPYAFHTFSDQPEPRPTITSVTLPADNIVAGCAANVRVDVKGTDMKGTRVAIGIIDADGKTVYSGGEYDASDSFSVTLKLDAATVGAFPPGEYTVLVGTVDGKTELGARLTIEDLPTDIWSVRLLPADGKTEARFAAEISSKNGFTVTVNGVKKPYTQTEYSLIINHEAKVGDVFSIAGVKYPRLFPSYSFTFAATYK